MTPNELADSVDAIISNLRARIIDVGANEYSHGDRQHIETLTKRELIINAVEEIDDALVYLSHLRTRLACLGADLDDE